MTDDQTVSRPMSPLVWDIPPAPFAFYTGKGGVGKTTIAAANAVGLADAAGRVLLVSTDPASIWTKKRCDA